MDKEKKRDDRFEEAIGLLTKGTSIRCAGFEAIKIQGANVCVKYPKQEKESWVHAYKIRPALEAAMDARKAPPPPPGGNPGK